MEKELELLTKAAREMYELQFPGEGGIAGIISLKRAIMNNKNRRQL